MGMAASQARLLALTARMHDIELRAQNIESQKLSLATQQDEAYQKYCAAMEASKIQIGISNGLGMSYIDANFSSMCGYHSAEEGRYRQYALVNNLTGKVLVDQNTKDVYDEYGADKYTFALMMLGYEGQFDWTSGGPYLDGQGASAQNVGINAGNPIISGFDPDFLSVSSGLYDVDPTDYPGWEDTPNGQHDLYMTEVEYMVFLNHVGSDDELDAKYQELHDATLSGASKKQRQDLLDDFRDYLYKTYGNEIFDFMNLNKNDALGGYDYATETFYDNTGAEMVPGYDYGPNTNDTSGHIHEYTVNPNNQNGNSNPEFNYYVQLWQQIHDAGGCEVMDPQYASGAEGTEWLNNMISAGLLSIYMLDPGSMNNGFELTTIATSYGNNYLQEVDDEAKAKKAEVEYEHELDVINRKDTKFDLQLKKLETEENACKQEIDSLKKVKDENIDRTFNLFS